MSERSWRCGRSEQPTTNLTTPCYPRGLDVLRVPVEDITDREFFEKRVRTRQWETPLYFAEALRRWPRLAADAVAAVALARPGGVLISCGRGCDRTGFLAVLLLHLVGVLPHEIARDYAASIDQMRERDPDYERQLMSTLAEHGSSVDAAVAQALTVPVEPTLRRGGLEDRWIADGNYGGTFDERFGRADTVVVIARSRWACTAGALRRLIRSHGRSIQAADCPERIQLSFLRWVWNYERDSRPRLDAALARHEHLEVVTLTSRSAMRRYLDGVGPGHP